MEASLFSWPGLVISVLIAVGILTVAVIVVRALVRALQRRRGAARAGRG
jgi:hypothetical protein